MVMAGWRGTDVKSAFTSNDTIHWFGCSWMPWVCWMKSWLFCIWYGNFPTNGLRILDSSFDVEYVTDPMLDTMGPSGNPSLCILGNP